MLIVNMRLQNFSEASNFCFITFRKLSTSLDNTAVIKLLLTEPDTSHIIKVNPCFEHKSKLRFTAYGIPEIAQWLTNIAKLFSTIWKDHGLLVDLPKQNWMAINLKKGAEPQPGRVYLVSHHD